MGVSPILETVVLRHHSIRLLSHRGYPPARPLLSDCQSLPSSHLRLPFWDHCLRCGLFGLSGLRRIRRSKPAGAGGKFWKFGRGGENRSPANFRVLLLPLRPYAFLVSALTRRPPCFAGGLQRAQSSPSAIADFSDPARPLFFGTACRVWSRTRVKVILYVFFCGSPSPEGGGSSRSVSVRRRTGRRRARS